MRPTIAAVLTALAIAGCGSSGSSDKNRISHVVTTWSKAFADGKGDVACRLMTTDAARHLTQRGSCAATVHALASSVGGPADAQIRNITIKSITIRSHQALVTVVGGSHPLAVVKRGGSWYFDHVEGQ
jgi:hypothetical protein